MEDNNFNNPVAINNEHEESINNDKLFQDEPVSEKLENIIDFSEAERGCVDLINYLNKEKKEFDKLVFLEKLDLYIAEHTRLIYSAITNAIYDLSFNNDTSADRILQNLSTVPIESTAKSSNSDKILKLTDHINLAIQQQNYISRHSESLFIKFNSQIGKAAEKQENKFDKSINDKIKSTEKDYITILGIFASIVLAFVAGFAFNTSVLENMHNNSIYKIVFIACLISEGTIHLVFLLLSSIFKIYKNESYIYPKWMKYFNYIVTLLVTILFVSFKVENYSLSNKHWSYYMVLAFIAIIVAMVPLIIKFFKWICFKRKLALINEVNCMLGVINDSKFPGFEAGIKELIKLLSLSFGNKYKSVQENIVEFNNCKKFNKYYKELIKFNTISYDTYLRYKNNKEDFENTYINCKYRKKNLKNELKYRFKENIRTTENKT